MAPSPSQAQVLESSTSPATITLAKNISSTQGFPAGSLVLMSNGKEKKIEDIRAGDLVASYDPILEDYIISRITNAHISVLQEQPIASIMLILDDLSASLQTNGSLAGVSLQVSTTSEVLTKKGPMQAQDLTEEDILYCYDDTAHRFLSFRVYDNKIIQHTTPQTFYKTLHRGKKLYYQ